jgi:hypothetical protein
MQLVLTRRALRRDLRPGDTVIFHSLWGSGDIGHNCLRNTARFLTLVLIISRRALVPDSRRAPRDPTHCPCSAFTKVKNCDLLTWNTGL